MFLEEQTLLNRGVENRDTDNRAINRDIAIPLSVPKKMPVVDSRKSQAQSNFIIPEEKKFTLYFNRNSYLIQPTEQNKLSELLSILQSDKRNKTYLVGHASTEGDPKYNLVLSQNRVNSIVQFLTNKGVARDQLNSEAMGDKSPAVQEIGRDGSKELEENRAGNRRVEIKVQCEVRKDSISPKYQAWVERGLERHREAINELKKRKIDIENRVRDIDAKAGQNLSGFGLAENQIDLSDISERLFLYQKNFDALKNAVKSDEKAIEQWYKEYDQELKNYIPRCRERIKEYEGLLAKAIADFEKASKDQRLFRKEVVDALSATIDYLQSELEAIQKDRYQQ